MIRKMIVIIMWSATLAMLALWADGHWGQRLSLSMQLSGRKLGDPSALAFKVADGHLYVWYNTPAPDCVGQRQYCCYRFKGFRVEVRDHASGSRLRFCKFPLWAPAALFACYPTVGLIRGPVRRYGRRQRGRCVRCSYDLRGLREPRCPECGTPFELPAPSADDNGFASP
jgi:hypothetical protein